ncbi:hypothetical protein CBR_g3610 [Chara braunii]|uniref:Uncharacterized protein n=1 Tax=Chara braunii TaxID=69332 RepID=A0A388KFU4_CHABU|nr:hypothetical protein CBR_g3610 [Chara braunii]|eukprot:GBG68911.1 hypothetical protein CBR_g3610 [Chara braunii]
MHPLSFFLWISPPGRGRKGPSDADKRYNNRSKLYRDKLSALDWVGVTGEPGCGAAVFLTEDEGATWYCCGGIIRSEIEKATAEKGNVDERDLRKFFLTSVYDEQGAHLVKTDHKVSLDLALFKGYGQKTFAMKAFGGKGDGNEFRMLLPVEFLSKTNGYRKSGQFPTVTAGHQLMMPLVSFDTPVESLAGLSTCSSDRRQVVSTTQQPIGGKQKVITYSRRSAGGSSATIPKTMELAGRPSNLPKGSRAIASSRSRDTPQHEMDEESDEETEEDERVRKLDLRLFATPGHIRGEGSCDVNVGREAGGGGEARLGAMENMTKMKASVVVARGDKTVAASGGVEYGSQGGSEMEDGELEDKGGDAGISAGLTSKRGGKRTAEESPTPAAPKKQAQRKSVDQARVALDASQETLGEPDVNRKSSARIRKTSQPKNLVRSSRRQKSDDSSDDAQGVAPRLLSLPDDVEQETKKPSAVNMTQCYFLEYDEEGKKRRDPPRVVIDVMQILRIPEGDIAFNRRSLNMAILAGLDAAIESSTGPRAEDDPARWEPPELVLASISPWKDDPDRQGTRVLPKDFDPDRADKYFYYPVAGQHTSEAMKRAVARNSAAVDVFDFRNYDRGKKEVFHCIPAKDGGPNATVSFKDLVPSNFKCFRDMTAREKEIALRLMINKKVIATTRLVPPKKMNMTNLLDIIMRERYMTRLFNYIVFKSENREVNEWKEGFFFDYDKMEQRFGINAGEWDEERDRIPLEYVRRVPKRLGGEQEQKDLKGAGLKAAEALYRDASFHFKYFVYHAIGKVDLLTAELRRLKNVALHLCWEKKRRRSTLLLVNMHPKELLPAADEIVTAATNLNCTAAILDLANPKDCLAWAPTDFDALHIMMSKLCGNNWILIVFAPQRQQKIVMRQLYNWDDVEVITGTWKRYLGVGTTVSKYENLQVDYKNTMAIVLHAEGGDLKKVTRIPKSEAELVELNVEEDKSKRCTAKHGGDEGNEREEYGRWERHSTLLQKLCSSFLHEDQGVILIGKPHAGLVWKLLRACYHVFACDASSKDISYCRNAIDILGKDTRNDCTVERKKTAHRPDRDMYHKLGKKGNKMWDYLFQGQPKSPFEHDYIVRKAMAQEAYGGYHKAQVGAFVMFVARCEQLKFTTNRTMLTYNDYSNLAKTTDAWCPIESDEETETSDLDIEERVKRSRDGMQSVPACSVQNENPEQGPTNSGGASSPGRDGRSPYGGNTDHDMLADADEDDLVVPDPSPKLMPGDDIPDCIVQESAQPYFIHDKVPETTSEKWGYHILWHTDVFEPCVFKGEWMMAQHLSSGWKTKPRLAEEPWLKVARSEIVFRVQCENDGVDEAAIEEKARLLFDSLRSANRLEYKPRFYDLPSHRSYNTIDWKIELPHTCQGIETMRLGCSQLGEQSTTEFAASVGEAMSQTVVKMMGVDKGTQNVNEDKSNVGTYGHSLITQTGNQSES